MRRRSIPSFARPALQEFATKKIFPDEIVCCDVALVFIPYTDPGLKLAQAIRVATEKFIRDIGRVPRVILMENHGIITLGRSVEAVLSAMLMAGKTATVWLGAAALGGPKFMTPEHVERIAGLPLTRRSGGKCCGTCNRNPFAKSCDEKTESGKVLRPGQGTLRRNRRGRGSCVEKPGESSRCHCIAGRATTWPGLKISAARSPAALWPPAIIPARPARPMNFALMRRRRCRSSPANIVSTCTPSMASSAVKRWTATKSSRAFQELD